MHRLSRTSIHGENVRAISRTVFKKSCFLCRTGPKNREFGKASSKMKPVFPMDVQFKITFRRPPTS